MIPFKLRPTHKAGTRILPLALVLSLLFTGCNGDILPSDSKWIDSNIEGAVDTSAEYRVQDDFAAAITKEVLLDESIPDTPFKAVHDLCLQRKRKLLEDTSVRNKGLDEVRKFAVLAEDLDHRKSQGIEPLKKYLEKIEAIGNIDDLYRWICSTEDNPLAIAPLSLKRVVHSPADPTAYITYLTFPDLTFSDSETYYNLDDKSLDKMECTRDQIEFILKEAGYDASAAGRIVDANFRMEKIIASNQGNLTSSELRDISYSRSDLEQAAESYPLISYLDTLGFKDTERYLVDMTYLRQLAQICKESNLAELKSFLMVQYIRNTVSYLDEDTLKTYTELGESRQVKKKPDEKKESDKDADDSKNAALFDGLIARDPILEAALDQNYTSRYVDDSSYDRLLKMTEKIIETYHDVFSHEEWMSEKGKAACIEKLDAISIHIIHPSEEILDFSDVNITSKEDGGNLVEAAYETYKAYIRRQADLSTKPFDRTFWDPYDPSISTTQTNAVYIPNNNGIYIFVGILEDPIYNADISDEELLAGIGCIVGHEITHGFDNTGVRYDKDGFEMQWMPEEDQQAFSDKNDKVASYYSTIVPFKGAKRIDGHNVAQEATADMGGIRVTLKIAENIPGFDYDKYFRHYGLVYAAVHTQKEEETLYAPDVHPLNYLRVNVGLQQFDEFHKTYDVKPKDSMYLEKKKRIAVW